MMPSFTSGWPTWASRRDAVVAGHCYFEAASERGAVNRHDSGLAESSILSSVG